MSKKSTTKSVSLSGAQIRFVLDRIQEYIWITGRNPSAADIDHSCLLDRLLSGKPALEKPPPCSYSCPNYALGEGQKVKVHIDDFKRDTVIDGHLVVDQSAAWQWHDKTANILIHVPSQEKYQLSKEDNDFFLQKIG